MEDDSEEDSEFLEEDSTKKFLLPSVLHEDTMRVQKFKKQLLLNILKQKLEEMYKEEFSENFLIEMNKTNWIQNPKQLREQFSCFKIHFSCVKRILNFNFTFNQFVDSIHKNEGLFDSRMFVNNVQIYFKSKKIKLFFENFFHSIDVNFIHFSPQETLVFIEEVKDYRPNFSLPLNIVNNFIFDKIHIFLHISGHLL